jgi:translation initiation factor IF-3
MKAVHAELVSEEQATRAAETMSDTPLSFVVDDDGLPVVVVLNYGNEGFEQAQKIAEVLS